MQYYTIYQYCTKWLSNVCTIPYKYTDHTKPKNYKKKYIITLCFANILQHNIQWNNQCVFVSTYKIDVTIMMMDQINFINNYIMNVLNM